MVAITFVWYWLFSEASQVDECLDRGGAFDYSTKSCIGVRK